MGACIGISQSSGWQRIRCPSVLQQPVPAHAVASAIPDPPFAALPPDFAGGQWRAWEPPELTLPSYCHSSELTEEEKQVVAFANHP